MAEIVIVLGGMEIGPKVLETKSLGGSETAGICAARGLRKLGHMVNVFGNVAGQGIDDDGIRWSHIKDYQGFVSVTEVDIIIAQRDANLLSFPTMAKKHVLWMHDLMTYSHLQRFQQFCWNIDEIWTVSEYHRQQVAKISGYPLDRIWATRNGISDVGDLISAPRSDKTLLYAARPERGLINLVRPGGIMSRLPDYTLKICMYDNYPEEMRGMYDMLFGMAKERGNCEFIGAKTQKQLRQTMSMSGAYVYPTQFEEVSCILAREAMSVGLPFIYTPIGALPETLKDCGHRVDWRKEDIGSDEFCQYFADTVKHVMTDGSYRKELERRSLARTDIGWLPELKEWEKRFKANKPTPYGMCASLMKDGDVIPAFAVAQKYNVQYWIDHIRKFYPFVAGEKTMTEHYKGIYELEEEKKVPERQEMRTLKGSSRYNQIKDHLNNPDFHTVLEYGCAEGPIILQLAMDFPDKYFVGIDIVETNVALCKKYAEQHNIKNVEFYVGDTENWPESVEPGYDCAIIAEVLEHTLKPWEIAQKVESFVRLGGGMIITVPYGSWEWDGLMRTPSQWTWRAHIWHVTKDMIRHMFSDKEAEALSFLPYGRGEDGYIVGNNVFLYRADHKPVHSIDPLDKADIARYRQSVAFCIIAMNAEDHIIRMLKSIVHSANIIQIALGPSNDRTRELADDFMKVHPYVDYRVIDVPAIEAGKYGFDDARNDSVKNVEADWIFWIDTDEYLSGNDLQFYLRDNAFDSYAIHQHHFTVEPRGTPTQLDKPARIYRNNGTFRFFGKVHEHAEKGFNNGPGFVMVLNNLDIGHTGYVNEMVRRQRFSRNFPLLEWDRKAYPERKIGKFLWFRDMYHQMAWLVENKKTPEAMNMARDMVDFFDKNKDDFFYIGSGPSASLQYYSAANKLINRGHAVKIRLEMEGATAEYEGIFRDQDEALEVAKRALKDQIDRRTSGYWQ